jgi:nucleotide-binding universal stress UspA family protein
MYERILVAIDHSKTTERVLAAARDLASLSKGEVWVLHLREREVIPRMGLVADETSDEASEAVQTAADELVQAGVDAGGASRLRPESAASLPRGRHG